MIFGKYKYPIELVKKGESDTVAWACGECGIVAPTKYLAIQCHAERICGCGNVLKPRHYTACIKCRLKHAHEQEIRKIAAAERLAEWDGPVFCEMDGYSESEWYFASLSDLLDELDESGHTPRHAWPCRTIGISLDATSIVENVLEDHHEDAFDRVDIESLQHVLDAWAGEQAVETWEPMTDKIIILPGENND
ncbi:MAG: hypothetical protein GY923_15360 [Aestuariibacter sp.]|nr:hypothetical protein [Aestuariibacter sp.]